MRTNYIKRLIGRITASSQSNNDSFVFYGHLVDLQSGTPDYVNVTIYSTTDPYKGEVTNFNYDFLTKDLCVEYAENENIGKAIEKGFREIYGHINTTTF